MSSAGVGSEPPFREEDASLLRKVIAKRMMESKLTNPHFYLTVDVNVEKLVEMRQAVDGATGAGFLAELKSLLENPAQLGA